MFAKICELFLGQKPDENLPLRVTEQIARQQAQSEKLIGWMQLGLVILFGSLYLIAPKTVVNPEFNPVPWALLIYLIFTLARLYLAYKEELPGWFLTSSVVIDIALLMVLIWSFHIQYQQPPSFYLKAPTLIYVFIFIALRALRFDPGYILLAGLTAASGWGVLMLYVFISEHGETMVTRNYIDYMTSNSMLVGAEVDKIVSILLVTLVLFLAVSRARRMMFRAVVDATAAQDLSKFVSKEVASVITSSDSGVQPGDGHLADATILFTDIEGFSTVSEQLSPDDLATMLNEYFGALSGAIDDNHGVITQFEGDAMLIAFNAVTPLENHVDAALKTALAIQGVCASARFLGERGIALATRCGISTGPVIVGAIGSKERLTLTVHGDVVNIAARLEQLNKQFGTYVMATEEVTVAAQGAYSFNRVGEITVKGRVTETGVYSVCAAGESCAPSDNAFSALTASANPAPKGADVT